jgi:hypothetical protein
MRLFSLGAAATAGVGIVCCAMAFSPALVSDEVTLAYKWKAGDKIGYETTTEQIMSMGGMPGMGDMKSTSKQVMTNLVETVSIEADGVATIKNGVTRFRLDMDAPMMGKKSLDSDKAEDRAEPEAAMYMAMVGRSYTVVLEPDGDVRDVTGFEEIVDAVMKNADAGNPMQADMMKEMMSKDFFKQMMETQYKMLPDKPVKEGDSWERSTTMTIPMIGSMTTTGRYVLKGMNGSMADIGVKFTYALEANENPQMPGMKFDM